MAETEENVFVKDVSKNNNCQTATELSEYLKSSVRNILSNIADEQFVSLYKTCYKEFENKDDNVKPELRGSSTEGRKYHKQFNEMIMESSFRTIEETVLNMDSKLKELEELKSSQVYNTVHWRPPGNATEHITPFEYISEMEKKKELQEKIEREQEVLNILKTRLTQKRNKAKELNKVSLSLIDEIKNIVTNKVNDEQLQEKV